MRNDKRKRAMEAYKGFTGLQTISHVERNLLNGFPTAKNDLTGIQYGQVMNVANMSYHDGKHTALPGGYSVIDDCLSINDSEQLIPFDVLKKIIVTRTTIATIIYCTGHAKHYHKFHKVFYTKNNQCIKDRNEADGADKSGIETYYIRHDYINKYSLNVVEND